ncbi:MAG: hypothetical protein GTO41_09215, partial [Burkholderiales bacterium]|nr:hypothetical protein [Burkholderiales bacterium]
MTANTDVDWASVSPAVELDDPGLAIDLAQIFIRTNGKIIATELAGDMLVGHIHSTANDVELNAPVRILDANRLPTIDVTAENITMDSGLDGGVGGIGLPSLPNPSSPNPADPGNLGGFLEINTDVNSNGGVLNADDTAANDAQTKGIYLDELTGNIPVDLIWAAGHAADVTTGNVGLRTVNGSIVDARNDLGDNVRGQSIDIDANGGSIGELNNDLDIDSSRGSSPPCDKDNCADTDAGFSDPGLAAVNDDVGLEATQNIYLTETDAYLRLVLAHAVNGDIRITVGETAAHDEDFFLIKSGAARFAESNTRAPSGDDLDAPRSVPKGQIFAEVGSVELRVGDDLATHQNSETLANLGIDIFGDFGDADAGWGTSMILRGRIIADCVV